MARRILIVDDDRDVCRVLSRDLKEDGYNTESVFNGLDGIKRIQEENFDLMILDLKLPDIQGTEVLSRVRAFNKKIIVLILTAYPSVETAVSSFKNNISEYIQKPYQASNLRTLIKDAFRKEETTNMVKPKEIGRKIKEIRLEKELSLEMLGKMTGFSKSFLSEMERGKKFPSLDTLQVISRELGISVYFFLKE